MKRSDVTVPSYDKDGAVLGVVAFAYATGLCRGTVGTFFKASTALPATVDKLASVLRADPSELAVSP